MKNHLRSLAATLLCGVILLGAGAASASAETPHYSQPPVVPVLKTLPPGQIGTMQTPAQDTFQCNVRAAWVQAKPSGYVIGNCMQGTNMRRSLKSAQSEGGDYWDGGYVFGNTDGCGWILTQFSSKTFGSSENLCPGGVDRTARQFARANNDGTGPNGGCSWKFQKDTGRERCTTGTRTTITANCDAYGNYRPWLPNQTPTDVLFQVHPGDIVRWRYITKYGFTGAANVPFVLIKNESLPDGGGNWAFVYQHCITDFPGYTENFDDV